MQFTILLVTLAIMALTAAVVLKTVLTTGEAAPQDAVNRTRSRLLWVMVALGVLVSVGSLREWPHRSPGADAMVVNITSGQWWWDTDTTEIPAGKQVEFRVTTEDVTHGLGIFDPELNLVAQVQAMPDYTNSVVHTFARPGTYQILCMEFCGIAHHDMTYEFEVTEQPE